MNIKRWFARRFARPIVTAESTPWGTAYTVLFDDLLWQSSCDGTLWNCTGRPYSFGWSERCRRAVRRAINRGTVQHQKSKWPELLGTLSPEHRSLIVTGGLKGQRNAKASRLLP